MLPIENKIKKSDIKMKGKQYDTFHDWVYSKKCSTIF